MGAATALYSATCFAAGKYGNGNPYPAKLSTVVGLSGWLPCAKYGFLCSRFDIPCFFYFALFCSLVVIYIPHLFSETH